MFEEYSDVLTVEEACEALRIGYNAIYDLLGSGKLKGYRNGAGNTACNRGTNWI